MALPEDPHYFIGIPAPVHVEEQLANWQEILSPFVQYRKWVNPLDFHMTLKFLGRITEAQLPIVKQCLAQVTLPETLQLQVAGVNFFGKEDYPRVMYAEVIPDEPLIQLQIQVENEMEVIGFDKERRPYRPHITLAKKWAKDKLQFGSEVLTSKLPIEEPVKFIADQINLYMVKPGHEKKYEIIERYSMPHIKKT